MGLMISSISKIGNNNLPYNLFKTSSDFYLYILEYGDFDFREKHNYSSEYHESGMSRILNNYSYNFRNQDIEILISKTFHSDSKVMNWRNIFDIENLDSNESKPALVSPAFLISTLEPSKLNKLELLNNSNDIFIYLKIEDQNRCANEIPNLVNEILDDPGVAISKCKNANFKSSYDNVHFLKYAFSENIKDFEIKELLVNIKSDTTEIKKNQKEIDSAVRELTTEQSSLIIKEIMAWVTTVTDEQNNDLTEKLNEIKDTDDVQMKLKLSIPFIKLLGVDFETEFNVKSWVEKMYKQHEFEIFKLMTY